MGVRVDEAGEDDVPAGIDDPRALRRGKRRPNAGDAVTVDEDVGARERRRAAAQDPATANQECHGCLCISRDPARVKARRHATKFHASRPCGDSISLEGLHA